MSIVSNIVSAYLPAKKKTTPSGWISFNAPCCHHNGQTTDKRGRGGLIINNDGGVSYHCFNCGFKCSWQGAKSLSLKFKKFLEWLNVPDNIIKKLSLELLKQETNNETKLQIKTILPSFKEITLPNNAILINEVQNVNSNILKIIEYISNRNLQFEDSSFYCCDNVGLKNRLIIPFYYNTKLVGYTARTIADKHPKYLTNSQPGYVFGLDAQQNDYSFTIICEGPIDALLIGATSILGSEISEYQCNLLNSYNTEKIVIPDRDKAGKKLIDQALSLGWSISFPDWDKNINDVGDAVAKYGRMLTLYSIITSRCNSSLKIKLRAKKWFG